MGTYDIHAYGTFQSGRGEHLAECSNLKTGSSLVFRMMPDAGSKIPWKNNKLRKIDL